MRKYLKRIPGLRKIVRLFRGEMLVKPREFLLKEMPPNSVCAEIGVDNGGFSEEILFSLSPRTLHLIDPWRFEDGEVYEQARYGSDKTDGQVAMDNRYESVRSRFKKQIESAQVVLHRGFSHEVVAEMEDGYFDWVYIDGNHLYEYVKQDLELYYPKIRPGGYLTGDDYGVEGWWKNGVQKAVDEFIQERPNLSLKLIHSQFIIKVPGAFASD